MKRALLVKDKQGNYVAVICNSNARADQLRNHFEDLGQDTYGGLIRVVSYLDVWFNEGGEFR